ncbi:MAG: OmpA family protein [Alphaproteobacteria bacterium]|nr:OmpA family protein [Alphaproteobacteria bacterium]MBV9372302.1 OmpA family protein [Alphaproteobacteria bacterium]MBV9899594.1 OmpA family protein [Alphaproteobacteria bacterium]
MTRLIRKFRPRAGTIILALLAAAGLTELGLQASKAPDAPSPGYRFTGDVTTDSVVSLGRGWTMVAPEGTVARDIVDWMASGSEGERYFEAGGRQFVGNSTELAPDAWNRIDRFVVMLRTNRDVRARIVGFSDASANAAKDKRLSEARARAVMIELVAHGIARKRLSFEGRGSADPIADNSIAAGRERNRRVAIILSRRR